jgi:FkbM family methyltransferase
MTLSRVARATATAAVALASCTNALEDARRKGLRTKATLENKPRDPLQLPLLLEDDHVPLFVKWEKYLGKDLKDVNFVQIGGNCGTNLPDCAVGGDPIWEYATRFNWNGIVLEPVPQIFSKLSENYQPYPSVKPVNAMVSNHSGVGRILDKAETSHEISLSRKKGVEVPTYTLETLWKDVFGADQKKVDLLVVDAEGNEPKILSGAFPEPKPKLVLFEISSLQPEDLDAIDKNLKKEGYVLEKQLKHQDKVGLTMPPQDALYKLRPEAA